MKLCTCIKCGWVHIARTRAEVEADVARFNAFYETCTSEVKEMYGNHGADVRDQEGCFLCHGKEFRDFIEGDCPDGVTIQGVIRE